MSRSLTEITRDLLLTQQESIKDVLLFPAMRQENKWTLLPGLHYGIYGLNTASVLFPFLLYLALLD